MALAAVTRFDDPYEALIAASALNAAGIRAVCHSGGLADIQFTFRQAAHGFGLWVDAENFSLARAFVAERRSADPAALEWTRHPQRWRGAPLAALAALDAGFTGWLIAGAKAKPSPMRIGTVITVFLLYAITAWGFVKSMYSIGLPL